MNAEDVNAENVSLEDITVAGGAVISHTMGSVRGTGKRGETGKRGDSGKRGETGKREQEGEIWRERERRTYREANEIYPDMYEMAIFRISPPHPGAA